MTTDKELFFKFREYANSKGNDVAWAHNGTHYFYWNPMTSDLYEAFKAGVIAAAEIGKAA